MFTPIRTRRLPGVYFEAQPTAPPDVLPRMDVALFVGFAASGPLHMPILVEDVAQFQSIFGEDAPLAWDVRGRERLTSYLAAAVRAFFRNGGVRCWVVRVADTVTYNQFPLPRLVRVTHDGKSLAVQHTLARARAGGSWSDGLRTSAALQSTSINARLLSVEDHTDGRQTVEIEVNAPPLFVLTVGDLLRLTFHDAILYTPIKSLETVGGAFRVRSDTPCWFSMQGPLLSPAGISGTTVSILLPDGTNTPVNAYLDSEGQLTLEATAVIHPGALLIGAFAGQTLCMSLTDYQLRSEPGSPAAPPRLALAGHMIWLRNTAALPGDAAGEVLRLELLTQSTGSGKAQHHRLSELGFAPGHTRYWGALPVDDALYNPAPQDDVLYNPAPQIDRSAFWQEAADPRFPLAGPDAVTTSNAVFDLPLFLSVLPAEYAGALPQKLSALERDGLSVFSEALFLDPALRDFGIRTLLEQANFLRYQTPDGYLLKGIHTALEVDEVSLIAIPDAVHPGWARASREAPAPARDTPEPPAEPANDFETCGLHPIPKFSLTATEPDSTGSFNLWWTSADLASYQFILEESRDPEPNRGAAIFSGTQAEFHVYGRAPGAYYYRVRALLDGRAGAWSNSVLVAVEAEALWVANPPSDSATLLTVQHALLRLCAARGDLLAVLAMPASLREDGALRHTADLVARVGFGEASSLTYGAIYHPWLMVREETKGETVRVFPPDGAMCGLLAFRAKRRGAWVAPANEDIRGVVGLHPAFDSEDHLDLLDAQINPISQEPRGFMVLSADTLASHDDRDLRPINVRRLLILLRRMALKYGPLYVFEPNSEQTQRRVERGFEGWMEYLFVRGAFAGDQPDRAYQVTVQTSRSLAEQDRLIVELKVAPSLPMKFLTVRLIQTGERSAALEVR